MKHRHTDTNKKIESNNSPELALLLYIKVHISKSETPNNVTRIKMHIKYTSGNIESEMGKSHPDICHEGLEEE
jgi:hypothetical protein